MNDDGMRRRLKDHLQLVLEVRPEGVRPRFAPGRPAGAVAESLLRRDAATSNLAAARLSNPDDVGGSQPVGGDERNEKGSPLRATLIHFLARPEGFEPPTLRFEA